MFHVQNDVCIVYWACKNGHIDLMRILIQAGADIKAEYKVIVVACTYNFLLKYVGFIGSDSPLDSKLPWLLSLCKVSGQ